MSDAVHDMFDRIAPTYDQTNTVLSVGQHRRWRRKLVTWAKPPIGGAVLDVATGTGDLAFEFEHTIGGLGRVVGVDFSDKMLDVAREKAAKRHSKADFRHADALALPFGDASFDVASIAFGIRNVDDPRRGVDEMARVVRPGGTVAVLEFGQPKGVMRAPYWFYSRFVLPWVGGRMSGDRQAYRYLRDTSAAFPSGDAFVALMESTGRFASVRARKLSGGIVYAYVGVVADKSSRARAR